MRAVDVGGDLAPWLCVWGEGSGCSMSENLLSRLTLKELAGSSKVNCSGRSSSGITTQPGCFLSGTTPVKSIALKSIFIHC